jgi:hypothetical protein
MTMNGWIFMVVSLSAVTGLVVACYGKILTAPAERAQVDDDVD